MKRNLKSLFWSRLFGTKMKQKDVRNGEVVHHVHVVGEEGDAEVGARQGVRQSQTKTQTKRHNFCGLKDTIVLGTAF